LDSTADSPPAKQRNNTDGPLRIVDETLQEILIVPKFSFIFFVLAILVCANSNQLFAEEHVEAGVFVDYLNISQTNTNNYGLGARLGIRAARFIALEGEFAYDYGINFSETYRNISNGNITAIANTSIGVTHGLIGPTLKPPKGALRPFVTLKGGFVDFRFGSSLVPYSDAASVILGLRTSSLNAAIYPGGGVEASLGPVGLRLEVGDELYFNRGGHNNLRATFGPIIRF
jgi:hypothetical protein